MRVSISTRESYQADLYCVDSKQAKQALNQNSISILAIDFHLKGRESGTAILRWAKQKQVLPEFVVITESDRNKRVLLALELTQGGYRTADGTTFIKH